jgi:hypothetical protein
MILKSDGRLIFLVETHTTPPRDFSKGQDLKFGGWRGGDIVLHKLAHNLAKFNQRVLIFTPPLFPHENISVLESYKVDSKDLIHRGADWNLPETLQYPIKETIAVYPEIQPAQPFNTKYIARWFLSDDNNYSTWRDNPNDVYFSDPEQWHTNKSTLPLKAQYYNFENLYKTNNGRRKGFCHFLHKYTPEDYESILKPFNSEDISDWIERGGISYLREKLNEYEYLITFDKHTAMTYLPGLCGCKTILYNADEHIEWKNMTPEEYRLKYPQRKYGCAYGFRDIEWANSTIDLVPDHLREMEKEDDKTVENFIDFWRKKTGIKK